MTKVEAEIKPICACTPEEAQQFTEWVWKLRDVNMFDKSIISYPRTCMLKATGDGEPLVYVPIQPVLMWDSIAAKPGIHPMMEAISLYRMGQVVDQVMTDLGYGESYFLCRDDKLSDTILRHGWEEVKNVRVLRKKIAPKQVAETETLSEVANVR